MGSDLCLLVHSSGMLDRLCRWWGQRRLWGELAEVGFRLSKPGLVCSHSCRVCMEQALGMGWTLSLSCCSQGVGPQLSGTDKRKTPWLLSSQGCVRQQVVETEAWVTAFQGREGCWKESPGRGTRQFPGGGGSGCMWGVSLKRYLWGWSMNPRSK